MLGKRNNNLPNGGEIWWFTTVPFCKKVTQLNTSKFVIFIRSFYSPWKMMMAWPYRRLLTRLTTAPASFHQLQGLLVAMELVPSTKRYTKREKGNLSIQKVPPWAYVSSQEANCIFPYISWWILMVDVGKDTSSIDPMGMTCKWRI